MYLFSVQRYKNLQIKSMYWYIFLHLFRGQRYKNLQIRPKNEQHFSTFYLINIKFPK